MLNIVFDTKMKELMRLQREADNISKQMDSIKSEIKAEMTARGVDSITTNKYSAAWKLIISNKFDSTAFKKAYGDLYKSYTKPSESKRFTFESLI